MMSDVTVNPAEYNALTAAAGVVDISTRTRIEMTGKDRASFLHGLCTNDVKSLLPGQGCEAFFTNVQGKTIGHAYIFCGEDSLILETSPGQAATLLTHLDRYLIREDVQLHDRSAEWGALLVAGENSSRILQTVVTNDLPGAALRHGVSNIAGHLVRVIRSGFLRVPTFMLIAVKEFVPQLFAILAPAKAATCSLATLDCLRIESGTPVFGQDITPENLPQELARDKLAIHFNKGCYLGQETVARLDALGHVNRTLVGIRFAGDTVPNVGTELWAGEKSVGHVTSASFSPRFQVAIALAFVRRSHNAPGTELSAGGRTATVVALPML